MSKKSTIKPLAMAISAAFVGSLAMSATANAGENPFAASTISNNGSYTIAAKKDGSCGEGKCGSKKTDTKKKSGSCGGDMKGKKKDGSCGGDKKSKKKDGSCGGKKSKTKDASCGGKK